MSRMHPTRPQVEIFVWLSIFLLLVLLSWQFHWHESLDAFVEEHHRYPLDDVFVALNISGFLGLIYSVLRIRDLSKEVNRRLQAEKNVDWIAYHDSLTELPNRRFLDSVCAQKTIDRWARQAYAVFSIDLDGFKKINDLLGHDHGDAVLKAVAQRLSSLFPGERVFRLGGDEFVILARRTGNPDLVAVGNSIVAEIGKPFTINGIAIDLGASVGLALYPDNGDDLNQVIRHSDCAMYSAKRQGRNLVKTFIPSMHDELAKRIRVEADLRAAIKNAEIVPYYQPLVDLKTNKVIGFEALARWKTASGEFIPPSEFIPVAEEAGLIVDLAEQLLRRACTDALSWPDDLVLSFNVSPLQLSDRLLGLRILKILGDIGFPAHRIELEVTESAIIQDAVTARIVLDDLVNAGVRIALDDFGTGYSSLSQLSNYQFDKIKIDRSFVTSFEANDKQDKVVKAIIALGAGLGVTITAEGIEEESQLRRLQDLGCDIGQGYLLGRPVPVEELAADHASASIVQHRR
ncbi:diguanylate cyclase (GGDEF) domain-containing protein [Rhizobium mongolense subsp. loessense]|uniref:Diguanylate cyclase (GGDEF) domain-containing protein n=1 Tax=Rhizobium mongolense subsp. loessense TaxID=158890 RepID=A0A1G4S3T1_9HYPH|nr:EAL domain-containing protein [Rhizobium mongolense]SCW63932.1 diguanylate cyclase (GGDEF) domain-containing protein [Rhizobium mongolense subsp. loessense]